MSRFVWLIVITVFLAGGSAVFALTVKQSDWRDYENNRNATYKKNNSDKDKPKQKKPRDANEPARTKEKQQDSKKDKDADTATGHQQQLKAIESQMAAEQGKWVTRKAQLEKIQDSATQQNDKKRADLAKSLLEKEQQQYDQKKQQMEEKRQKLLDLIQQESPKDPNKPAK